MNKEESAIQKYIDEKKELQELVFQVIDESESENDAVFQTLQNHLDLHQYEENKPELEHFLHLISNISINHHRFPNFFEKIEKILTITLKFYKRIFSIHELITIFQGSKPILLFLLKTKIIIIDEIIFQQLLNYKETKENKSTYYFYPELNEAIKSGTIQKSIYQQFEMEQNEDIENFEKNRQRFENESIICSLIRED